MSDIAHITAVLDWKKLPPRQFEKLCSALLAELGFDNIKWHGAKGSDRGRDILAHKVDELISTKKRTLNCVIQCKHLVRKSITPAMLKQELAWVEAHTPDVFILMTSATLTSATKDWVAKMEQSCRFRIYVMERIDLELQLVRFPWLLFHFFKLDGRKPLLRHESGHALACGFCGSPATIEGAYFVLNSCNGCAKVIAMCRDCIVDTRVVFNDQLHCRECGRPLTFASGQLHINFDTEEETPNKPIDSDDE